MTNKNDKVDEAGLIDTNSILTMGDMAQRQLDRRTFLASAAAVAGGVFLAACGGQAASSTGSSGSGSGSSPSKKYTLALVQGVKGDPFYVTMQKGAQMMADKLGATLVVDGPAQFDAALQAPIVDALIAKKVDAMIIAACDKQAMIAPLQRANDAGIKVPTMCRAEKSPARR
jgi:ribose transport system substrate-binding protein